MVHGPAPCQGLALRGNGILKGILDRFFSEQSLLYEQIDEGFAERERRQGSAFARKV